MKKFVSILLLVFILAGSSSAVDVPGIISTQSFLGTTSISTTLFVPKHDGLYRITTFIENPGGNFMGNPSINFSYTANTGAASTRSCIQTESDNRTMQCVENIRPIANNNVTINVTVPVSSDVYVVVERLF